MSNKYVFVETTPNNTVTKVEYCTPTALAYASPKNMYIPDKTSTVFVIAPVKAPTTTPKFSRLFFFMISKTNPAK